MKLDDYCLEVITLLQKLCHSKYCRHHKACPQYHESCRKRLGYHTANLWQIADVLKGVVNETMYHETARSIIIHFGLAMGQHDRNWFRLMDRIATDFVKHEFRRTSILESGIAHDVVRRFQGKGV